MAQKDFDPGPPIATKLGMSDNWAITAYDHFEDTWTHFLCIKLRKQYELWVIDRFEERLINPAELVEPTGRMSKAKKAKTPKRFASIDTAVEFVDDLCRPDEDDDDD